MLSLFILDLPTTPTTQASKSHLVLRVSPTGQSWTRGHPQHRPHQNGKDNGRKEATNVAPGITTKEATRVEAIAIRLEAITTWNKKLLVTKGIATRSKDATIPL